MLRNKEGDLKVAMAVTLPVFLGLAQIVYVIEIFEYFLLVAMLCGLSRLRLGGDP